MKQTLEHVKIMQDKTQVVWQYENSILSTTQFSLRLWWNLFLLLKTK